MARGETARLQALLEYDILDTPPEPRFDRIVHMASRLLEMPISLVSLLDDARQWFKAKVGLDADVTPRDIAFCHHAIEQDKVMVIEDATEDPRFQHNPLVTDMPNIRFYAGAPLKTEAGYKLGTLCVIDRVPRVLTEEQCSLLEDLAALVVDEMELRRANAQLMALATTDSMTGLWNRRRFFSLAEAERERSRRYGRPLSLLMFDVDRFKLINDGHGHDIGDQAIIHIARTLTARKRPHDIAARIGGEEFVLLMPETDLAGATILAERLREAIATSGLQIEGETIQPTVSIGVSAGDGTTAIRDLLKTADLALYDAKKGGRNRVCQRVNGAEKSE
jgi:diguanylate cyclase (GGDEF)-like protein